MDLRQARYQAVERLGREYKITKICKTLRICRSAYYEWKTEPQSKRECANNKLLQHITRIHRESKGTFGSPRIVIKLKEEGIYCNHKRVERLMKENDIYSKTKRKFKITTDSNHQLPVCENILVRNFKPEKANQSWCSDITYIRTAEGWLYLAVVLDLFSRRVIGWSMSESMSKQIVMDSFMMAWESRGKPQGVIFHSDRGSQYASNDFRNLLQKLEVIQSMSRRANCWDNACAESFFASLKKEEVYLNVYATREQAKSCIFEYIEIFYNAYRPHSYVDGLSPNQYEMMKARENKA